MTGPGARDPQPGEPEHRPRWQDARRDGREVEEAKRWFRENPDEIDRPGIHTIHTRHEHAATIVRAALAARPLQADDIQAAHQAWVRLSLNERDAWSDEESFVAERLNGARAALAAGPDDEVIRKAITWREQRQTGSGNAAAVALADAVERLLAGARPAAEPDGDVRGEHTDGAARYPRNNPAQIAELDDLEPSDPGLPDVPPDVTRRWLRERDEARQEAARLRSEAAALRDTGNALAGLVERWFNSFPEPLDPTIALDAWRSVVGGEPS